MNIEGLSRLSNEELLSNLAAVVGDGRRLLAKLLAYLGEVEARDLHLEAACSSLFGFCVRRLGMSEGEAFRRLMAARLARRLPIILEMVASGEIHLSALVLSRDHLTPENHRDLLAGACKKTKREVQELIAARFPKPDAPTSIRALPDTSTANGQAVLAMPDVPASSATSAPKRRVPEDRGRALAEPLSPTRYKLQVTISAELKEKLAHATNLMMHRNPTGDLEVVLGRAVELLIAELEKQRFGKTKRPRKEADSATTKSTRPGYVTNAVRREVYERDGGQCTFVDEMVDAARRERSWRSTTSTRERSAEAATRRTRDCSALRTTSCAPSGRSGRRSSRSGSKGVEAAARRPRRMRFRFASRRPPRLRNEIPRRTQKRCPHRSRPKLALPRRTCRRRRSNTTLHRSNRRPRRSA